jgi:hypothetical protein
MNEVTSLRMKADLWWAERRGWLKGMFKNPLFLALGVRVSRPDPQTVHLRLPWGKPQRLLAAEIPMAILVGSAEMALTLHLSQFEIFAPVLARVSGVDIELPKRLDQSVEFRIRSTWEEWEALRLELVSESSITKDFVFPIWSQDNRTLGTVTLRTNLQIPRYLTS